jgi:hypothetical protein
LFYLNVKTSPIVFIVSGKTHTGPAGIIIFSGYQFHDSLNQQKKPGGISSARQIFEPTIPTLGRR